MNATFKLDGCHTLVVGGSNEYHVYPMPDGAGYLIPVALIRHPLLLAQIANDPTPLPKDEKLAEVYLKPSQMRAIASAMLSAATEARR